MTKGKTRGLKRSGVVERSVTRTTYDNIRDWAKANNANYDKANIRAQAEELLTQWESEAFAVYGRNGLPVSMICWRASPDQPWRPIEERPENATEGGLAHAYVIGKQAAPADSEVGFATAILKAAYMARSRLTSADSLEVWKAFLDGALLAHQSEALRLEFTLAPWVGPGRVQADGRRLGGLAKAKEDRPVIEARHRVWQTEAARLKPELSRRAKAKIVASKLRDTDFEASADTIRKAIT